MRRIFTAMVSATLAGVCFSQTQGTVPPDYPAQVSNSLDAQIEMVRRNYEDVKAKAQAKLDQENAQKRREEERALKARLAKEKKAAERAAKLEKRADESAELDLELKRLKVQRAKSRAALDEAIDKESIERVKDIVDAKIKGMKN